ncbi:MAG: site-specific integrase [Synergistaceae bacterium]|jgi:integrase|nr:site-specific integrase [Synergistaceae bacterium]
MEVDSIKYLEQIGAMKKFLENNKRDQLLFVMGINTALRIGDLLSLKIADVLNGNGHIADAIELREKKTGKVRRFPLNASVKKILADYLSERETSDTGSPLFISKKGGALGRVQAWRILKAAGKHVGINNIGAHSLRKTFGYHVYKNNGNDIALVQKLLNHSVSSTTLRYIGITRDIMDTAYLELNL